jgi:glycosyltransferase involved in cell wall biosynthesis
VTAAGLRIALLASARHPIAEPFAGGLEAHTWTLARALRERGHEVTLFAGPGSDRRLNVHELPVQWPRLSRAARADESMTAPAFLAEHHAYLQVMLTVIGGERRYDVVHNNSLHYLPVAMASASSAPVLTTLHTPPTPWLESAAQLNRRQVTFVAVSDYTARAWRPSVGQVGVIRNGIDITRWRVGSGGGPLVWFGRLVAAKGADLALLAAHRAGLALDVAGPVSDERFFRDQIQPLLDEERRYVGHLSATALAELVGSASATLVTPRWDEPFGLVVAESLACGTPVAAFARGAVPDLLDASCGVLAAPDALDGLPAAAIRARELPRAAARRRALAQWSHTVMVDQYCALYERLANGNSP